MSVLAIALALLAAQSNGPPRWSVHRIAGRFSDLVVKRFPDGRHAWLLVVGMLGAASYLADVLLARVHPALAFLFSVVVLYLAFEFQRERQSFSDIHVALRLGEVNRARQLLGEWRGKSYEGASRGQLVRLAVEEVLVASYQNVFAVIFWFLVLAGPAGAVIYRAAVSLDRRRAGDDDSAVTAFGRFAEAALYWFDWVPVRLTAFSLSAVENFEDALACWRTQSRDWKDATSGILLASGGGALGVRLGRPIRESGQIVIRPALGCGKKARVGCMQAAVSLVWRALMLCLLVLGLTSVAGWAAP